MQGREMGKTSGCDAAASIGVCLHTRTGRYPWR